MNEPSGTEELRILRALPEASDLSEVLEAFVAHRLFEAGVWSSPRASDGVSSYRVVERGPERLQVAGRIWDIQQTKCSFWIRVEWDREASHGASWWLYFDVDETTAGPRLARHAVDVIGDPEQVEWRIKLTGYAGASAEGPETP